VKRVILKDKNTEKSMEYDSFYLFPSGVKSMFYKFPACTLFSPVNLTKQIPILRVVTLMMGFGSQRWHKMNLKTRG
jgi:hypothetical protein